jgi:hypothetical protein
MEIFYSDESGGSGLDNSPRLAFDLGALISDINTSLRRVAGRPPQSLLTQRPRSHFPDANLNPLLASVVLTCGALSSPRPTAEGQPPPESRST